MNLLQKRLKVSNMEVIVQPEVKETFCDITGEKLIWDIFEKGNSMVGCSLLLNKSYEAMFDNVFIPNIIHMSEEVTTEFLLWLKEKYPDSPFIKQLNEEEFF